MFSEYADIVDVETLCKMLQIGKNKAYELLQSKKIKPVKSERFIKYQKDM